VAAKFFNIYMKAFIRTLLGHDPHNKNSEGGIFRPVKGYYGCVEAQGRGTLHCHMLVWLKGGLNPDEIKHHVLHNKSFKTQLLNFMEDSISTSVPDDPEPMLAVPASVHHPCSIQGMN